MSARGLHRSNAGAARFAPKSHKVAKSFSGGTCRINGAERYKTLCFLAYYTGHAILDPCRLRLGVDRRNSARVSDVARMWPRGRLIKAPASERNRESRDPAWARFLDPLLISRGCRQPLSIIKY